MAFDIDAFLATLEKPVWWDAEHTKVVLTGKVDGEDASFLATPHDPEPHGQAVWDDINAGKYGEIAEYVPPPAPPVSELAARASATASMICQQIITQIQPDSVHASAFANAASIVNAAGGVAPTSGPMAARFAKLAAAYGMKKPDGTPDVETLAVVVLALQGASFDLSDALMTLQGSIAAAASAADIKTAITDFDTSIAAVVAEVNAVVASPIVAPAASVVPGVTD